MQKTKSKKFSHHERKKSYKSHVFNGIYQGCGIFLKVYVVVIILFKPDFEFCWVYWSSVTKKCVARNLQLGMALPPRMKKSLSSYNIAIDAVVRSKIQTFCKKLWLKTNKFHLDLNLISEIMSPTMYCFLANIVKILILDRD